jgi:hypothetical protein
VPLRRVFITGVGVVSPHGEDLNAVFDRVFAGESAIRKVQVEADESITDMLLASVDFDPDSLIPQLQGRYMARVSKMAVVAAHHALEGSGLLVSDAGPAEAGIYMGCGLGGADEIQSHYERYLANPSKRLRAASMPMIMASAPASQVSMRFGILGPTVTYSMACVSSGVAIGEAFRAIRHGYVDTVLAGGAEAQLNTGTLAGWRELSVLASEHETGVEASSRPFDTQRTGLVLGEGAIVLVLESERAARARGAEGTGRDRWLRGVQRCVQLDGALCRWSGSRDALGAGGRLRFARARRVRQCACHGYALGRPGGSRSHQEHFRLACPQGGGELHEIGSRPPDRCRERPGGRTDGSYVTDRSDRAHLEPHRSRSGVRSGLRAAGRPGVAGSGVRPLELVCVRWQQCHAGIAEGDSLSETNSTLCLPDPIMSSGGVSA